MSLTAVAARNAKPREKSYKLAAGAGLYLEVMPTGARYWRMKYRYAGKEKRLALGGFPEVSLGDARDGADKARALLRDGVDPSAKRKADSPSAVRGPVEHPPCHRQRRLPGPDISEIPIIQLDGTKIWVAHESGAWKVRDLHPLPYGCGRGRRRAHCGDARSCAIRRRQAG